MTDRNKIIDGLTYCHIVMSAKGRKFSKCDVCPYNKGNDDGSGNKTYCVANLVADTLELITPRVLFLGEIKRGMAVWLEDIDKPETMLAIGGASCMESKCFIDILDRSLAVKDAEYNIRWRAWTAEPTKEQREAVEWIGS
jgi:hypothetical protein